MILDLAVKAQITNDWSVVRKLSSSSHRSAALHGAGWIIETRSEDSYNLPLLLAYAVLDQVLAELVDQKTFSCSSWKLGEKMAASRSALLWRNYSAVHAGKEARNKLAHEAVLALKADCLRFIDAVEDELRGWAIL